MKNLEDVLKSLKMSQSQDTMDLVNESFSLQNIGTDLKTSLLMLFNNIKNEVYIPEFFREVHITSIPKKKISALRLDKERSIFLVPKLRAMYMKLIYNSIIDDLEGQISPSNIGARRGKSIRKRQDLTSG